MEEGTQLDLVPQAAEYKPFTDVNPGEIPAWVSEDLPPRELKPPDYDFPTLGERLLGLSIGHISPDDSVQLSVEDNSGTFEVCPDGSLLKVHLPRERKRPNEGGGERGKITRFSRKAAQRLRERIFSMQREKLPLFVHLTYPGCWITDGEKTKADLDTLRKRMMRKFPRTSAIWKMELKPRKSGAVKGSYLPHYHLLIWTNVNRQFFQRWITDNWFEIVWREANSDIISWVSTHSNKGKGVLQEKLDHLAAGTKVEEIRSPRGTAWYVGEYMVKEQELPQPAAAGEAYCIEETDADGNRIGFRCGRLELESYGQFWGWFNKKHLPYAEKIACWISRGNAKRMLRILKKLLGRDHMPYSAMLFREGGYWKWFKWISIQGYGPPNANGLREMQRRYESGAWKDVNIPGLGKN